MPLAGPIAHLPFFFFCEDADSYSNTPDGHTYTMGTVLHSSCEIWLQAELHLQGLRNTTAFS